MSYNAYTNSSAKKRYEAALCRFYERVLVNEQNEINKTMVDKNIKGEIRETDFIKFEKNEVKYYYDPCMDESSIMSISWKQRKPYTFQDLAYVDKLTNTIKYSERDKKMLDSLSKFDKQIVPIFIVGGYKKLSDGQKIEIHKKLISGFRRRNNL